MEMERDHFCLWVPQIKGLHPGHAFGTNSLLPHSHFPLPCMIPLTFYFWLPLCQIFFLHRATSLQAPASGGRRKGCLFPYSGRTVGSDQLCRPFVCKMMAYADGGISSPHRPDFPAWLHREHSLFLPYSGPVGLLAPPLEGPGCRQDMNKREIEMHLFDLGKILSWLHKFSNFHAVVISHLLLLESSFSFKYRWINIHL